MAAGLLKKMALENQLAVEVQSAGLAAFAGVPATPEAIEAGKTKGIDLSAHQSQPLGKTLVMESDLILTMTEKHKEMILKKLPSLGGKVILLSEFAGAGVTDVDDPVGKPVEEYQRVLNQMEDYLRKAMNRFK
jgi:protein-tyrosine-phosphatase